MPILKLQPRNLFPKCFVFSSWQKANRSQVATIGGASRSTDGRPNVRLAAALRRKSNGLVGRFLHEKKRFQKHPVGGKPKKKGFPIRWEVIWPMGSKGMRFFLTFSEETFVFSWSSWILERKNSSKCWVFLQQRKPFCTKVLKVSIFVHFYPIPCPSRFPKWSRSRLQRIRNIKTFIRKTLKHAMVHDIHCREMASSVARKQAPHERQRTPGARALRRFASSCG